jgi:hypothetical protein
MSTITENDLKELKELILSGQKAIETRLTALESGQKAIETRLIAIESRLAVIEARTDEWRPFMQKVPDLAEKVGELKNWRQIVIITITASISGLMGWLIRGGNYNS